MKRILGCLAILLLAHPIFANETELDKLTSERNRLRNLLIEVVQGFEGLVTDKGTYNQVVTALQRGTAKSEDVKALLNSVLYRCSRERKALKTILNSINHYNGAGIDPTFSNDKTLKDVQQITARVRADLDRLVLYEYHIKELKNVLKAKEYDLGEKQETIQRLSLKANSPALRKTLSENLPKWQQLAKDLAELRNSLPDKRLTDAILNFNGFDKDSNGVIDAAELKVAEKQFIDRLTPAQSFGLAAFDKDRNDKLSEPERLKRNQVFDAIAMLRLADLNADGQATQDEIKLMVLTESMLYNHMAEKFAGGMTKAPIPPSSKIKRGVQSDYSIQSIQSANSLMIGRANFTLNTRLYGVKLPETDAARDEARTYLVNLLAETEYRIDHKSASNDTRRTLHLLEKLSTITISKVSFMDTRISTVFEFLKNRSRAMDPTGEGINFQLYPELLEAKEKPDGPSDWDNGAGAADFYMVDETRKDEPLVTMDLDNQPLADVILNVAQVTGSTIEIENGMVYVRLPHATPKRKQTPLLQLSLYLPKKGHTANYLLIRNGYTSCSFDAPTGPIEQELFDAQSEAQEENLGIWKK